jgi:hypothetical protein
MFTPKFLHAFALASPLRKSKRFDEAEWSTIGEFRRSRLRLSPMTATATAQFVNHFM